MCCVGGTRAISCLDSPTPFLPGVCVCVVGVQELEEQRGVVGALEENLVFIKQQRAVVYQDFAARAAEWEGKEKRLEEEKAALRREKDEAAFRLDLQRIAATTLSSKLVHHEKVTQISPPPSYKRN